MTSDDRAEPPHALASGFSVWIDSGVIRGWRRAGLLPTDFLLYGVLRSYADGETGEAWPSQETLAGHLQSDVSTVQRCLSRLTQCGLVETRRHRRAASTYVVKALDTAPMRGQDLDTAPMRGPHRIHAGSTPHLCGTSRTQRSRTQRSEDSAPEAPWALGIAEKLREVQAARKPGLRHPTAATIRKWAVEIDRLHRIDKVAQEQIAAVVNWLPQAPTSDSGFCWANQVLSGAALRRHWDSLLIAMERGNGHRIGQAPSRKPAGADGLPAQAEEHLRRARKNSADMARERI